MALEKCGSLLVHKGKFVVEDTQQIPVSIDEMQRSFGTVVSKTIKTLELSITAKQFAGTVLALGAYEPVMKKEQALLEDYEDELFQAETITDIY